MENTVENAIHFLMENHKCKNYDDFKKGFTKLDIGRIMVSYAEQLNKPCVSNNEMAVIDLCEGCIHDNTPDNACVPCDDGSNYKKSITDC